ncbi:MAG: Rpn family recombination-promoting nuclease/putative transposase [Peptococcaceae bacterium]|nr:Rpn family recombination-promoting nuclease/putative transposase [Peptococcaceae bacterium]
MKKTLLALLCAVSASPALALTITFSGYEDHLFFKNPCGRRPRHAILKTKTDVRNPDAIYHLCDLHSGQEGRGIRYDKLLRSIQMTLCGYTVFPKREDFVSRYSFRDENGWELSDAVGIIFIELTKLSKVIKKPVETMTGEELWSVFFAYGSDPKYRELLNKLTAVRGEIKMAKDLLQTISKDEIERAHFRSRRMFRMDMEHNLIAARDEGHAEGHAEGRTKGHAEGVIAVARNMLKRNRSIDDIAEDTGLTREEVENLRDNE